MYLIYVANICTFSSRSVAVTMRYLARHGLEAYHFSDDGDNNIIHAKTVLHVN